MPNYASSQFEVNEAWIVFQLNDTPVVTKLDGDFNVIGLMDAADGYMLGTEFVSTSEAELSQFQAKHLLKVGQQKSNCWPQQLIVQSKLHGAAFVSECKQIGMKYTQATDTEIWPIIGEAVEGLRLHLGNSGIH